MASKLLSVKVQIGVTPGTIVPGAIVGLEKCRKALVKKTVKNLWSRCETNDHLHTTLDVVIVLHCISTIPSLVLM